MQHSTNLSHAAPSLRRNARMARDARCWPRLWEHATNSATDAAYRRDRRTWAAYLLLGLFAYLETSLGPAMPFIRAQLGPRLCRGQSQLLCLCHRRRRRRADRGDVAASARAESRPVGWDRRHDRGRAAGGVQPQPRRDDSRRLRDGLVRHRLADRQSGRALGSAWRATHDCPHRVERRRHRDGRHGPARDRRPRRGRAGLADRCRAHRPLGRAPLVDLSRRSLPADPPERETS